MKLKLGFFASGSGSNVQAIIDSIKKGRLDAEAKVVITNNSRAEVIDRAKRENIPFYHISRVTHPAKSKRTAEMINILKKYDVDLIVLGGYMKKLPDELLQEFNGKVINIHPALLPDHGGKGMYGLNVHKAVVDSGDKETGVSIHIVTPEYDRGRIIAQRKIPVMPYEKPEALQKRVLKVEHELYPEIIDKIAKNEIIF